MLIYGTYKTEYSYKYGNISGGKVLTCLKPERAKDAKNSRITEFVMSKG